MNILPTRVHAILDYVMGLLLICLPWILGFDIDAPESVILIVLGIAMILYSLFTDYEYSVSRKLSMSSHLIMDIIGGILLAASPWIFDFDERVYLPHVVLGIVEVLAAVITKRVPSTHKSNNTAHLPGSVA